MIDHGLEMLIPYLIAERHEEVRAARAAAAVAAGRPGLRARSAAFLARLAVALHPQAAASAALRPRPETGA